MKQNSPELGKLISGEGFRDAIHVAVAPAVARMDLQPGQRVGRADDGTFGPVEATVGIVDPFLTGPVPRGATFWLLLFPGTITSLRHEWTHPLFDCAARVVAARALIEARANAMGYTADRLLDACHNYVDSGGEEYEYDNTESYKDVDFGEEFWAAFQTLTGKEPLEWRGVPFTCSC